MTTLLDVFAEVTGRFGERDAIVEADGGKVTFAELDQRALVFAAGFAARGIGKGDRVMMAMPVGIDLFACLAALWRLGATVVFPEPAMGLMGLRHAARTTRPKAFLSSGWYRLLGLVVPELRQVELRVTPVAGHGSTVPNVAQVDDVALISFTSGSTGRPKAIARSHRFMMAQANAVSPLLATSKDDERDLVAFPVFVLVCLSLGITAVLPGWKWSGHDKVRADVIADQVARQKITRLLVPPVICETLSRTSAPSVLRAIFTGGGPVFPDVMSRLAALSPNMRLVAVYGSTEAEPIAHVEFCEVGEDDLEAMRTGGGLLAGRPVDAVAVEICDGEIQVAGAHVNESYLDIAHNTENKVVRGGRIWHRTGDAGTIDERGRIWLLGRHGNRVGDVDPFAVETAARFWPGLRRSALIALDGKPVLCVEGDSECTAEWSTRAALLGIDDLRHVTSIPMDRRHRSKVDLNRLRRRL